MPLFLLAGSMFGVLNIAAAAKNRVVDVNNKSDAGLNSAKLSHADPSRSIGNLLAARLMVSSRRFYSLFAKNKTGNLK
jgi:hypothetical protein